jgi:exosortase H (IPTLxxWG-CTERM-specific)
VNGPAPRGVHWEPIETIRHTLMASRTLKPRIVFVAKFCVALLVLYAVVALNPVNDAVIVPFTELVAQCSALMLRSVEGGVAVTGTVMRSARFALDVRNGCNGVEATILLIAAILAFPATLRSRLLGLTVASVAIELLNLVRLSSLFWLGEHDRWIFDFFHIAVWQSLIILAAISMFVLWSWKFAEQPLAESR